MVIINDIFISDDLFEKYFICDLSKCKGACCWQGDYGAPLSKQEEAELTNIYPKIKHYLSKESVVKIESEGLFNYYEEPKFIGTPILPDGSCVYLIKDKFGIAKCGLEKAWQDGVTDFQKPISCHLYPVRMIENEETGFTAMNYDQWDICSAACSLGEKKQMPLFEFVQNAIVRKYGEAFFEEMKAYYMIHIIQRVQ